MLSLVFICAASAPSSHLGLGALARVGAVVPTSRLHATYVVGVEIRERLPILRRVLGFSVDFGFFRPSLTGSSSDPSVSGQYTYDVSARGFQLGADVLAFLPLGLPVDLYAGVGYAAFAYAATAQAFGATSSEFQTRSGLRVRAGALWTFWGPLYVAGEVAYHYATFGFDITGPSSAGTVAIYAQLGFEL